MSARLIAVTQPVVDGLSSAEDLVAYCARVSAPANQQNLDTAPRLLGYMLKKHHWSPFDMAHVVIEIETTRDIGRQILRHWSFRFQEFSQRYAQVTNFSPPREARVQDTRNRQNSTPTDDAELRRWWEQAQRSVMGIAQDTYQLALNQGIAKEQARVVLPEGLTMSRMYMAGTLRSWIHYCALRTGEGTQKEHIEIALRCRDIIAEVFPATAAALTWTPPALRLEPEWRVPDEPVTP